MDTLTTLTSRPKVRAKTAAIIFILSLMLALAGSLGARPANATPVCPPGGAPPAGSGC